MNKIYNILIAENDNIINSLLDSHNHPAQNIFFVNNIIDTLNILHNHQIDAAILDVDLPHAEAYEILRFIETNQKITTEIIIFSHVDDNYFLNKKYVNIYNKPLNVQEVKHMIDNICIMLDGKNKI